jgi:hypothetical protein
LDELYEIISITLSNADDAFKTDTLNVCGLMTTGDIPPPRSFHTQVNIGNNMIGNYI